MLLRERLSTWLDQTFRLAERETTISIEVRAGTTSFLTLSYLLLVNPQILMQAGITHADALFATAFSASVSCFIVGFGGNLPFGCAPGLGLSAYLTFGLVQPGLCTLSEALSTCFWSGVAVLLIGVTGLASWLMRSVREAIKYAIVVGMGMLIAFIGAVSVNLVVANPKTLVQLGNVLSGDSSSLQLAMAGVLLIASLLYHNIKGGILIGIVLLTAVDWIAHGSAPQTIFQAPQIPVSLLFNEFAGLGAWEDSASVLFPALAAFVLICVFDISGVMFGLATLAGLMEEGNNGAPAPIPGSKWAFVASAVGTVVAAFFGSTPIIVCVECASGVREGGRTGLTAVVVGLYFLASLFLAPLFSAVPELATAPVLLLVGVMMMGESAKIQWDNMVDALPAFLTILLMPLTYSITNGMIFGLVASLGLYITSGEMFQDIARSNLGSCVCNFLRMTPIWPWRSNNSEYGLDEEHAGLLDSKIDSSGVTTNGNGAKH